MSERIIDISLDIGPDLMTWPGDPGIEIVPSSRLDKGDPANVSQLRLGTHTGTHVDPPWHFVEGGATVDQLDLSVMCGEAFVANLGDASGAVGPAVFEAAGIPVGVERVLLKTQNSSLWRTRPMVFPDEAVSVSGEGAAWIVERGIKLVGIDFLSVEAEKSTDHATHKTLLGAGVVVVEGLDLDAVAPGMYDLICLPLRIEGGDGAPARAVLLQK